jgi:hypothetical protein
MGAVADQLLLGGPKAANEAGSLLISARCPVGRVRRQPFYCIPLRSLIPEALDNVVAAGRGLSTTHEVHGSILVMPLAMAVGQAAGTAAAMMAVRNAGATELPVGQLRARLAASGAFLG